MSIIDILKPELRLLFGLVSSSNEEFFLSREIVKNKSVAFQLPRKKTNEVLKKKSAVSLRTAPGLMIFRAYRGHTGWLTYSEVQKALTYMHVSNGNADGVLCRFISCPK